MAYKSASRKVPFSSTLLFNYDKYSDVVYQSADIVYTLSSGNNQNDVKISHAIKGDGVHNITFPTGIIILDGAINKTAVNYLFFEYLGNNLFVKIYNSAVQATCSVINYMIMGTVQVGQPLTAMYDWNCVASEGATLYKWYAADNTSGLNRALVATRTRSTTQNDSAFTLVQAQFGKVIQLGITAVDSTGVAGSEVLTGYSAPVAAAPTTSTTTTTTIAGQTTTTTTTIASTTTTTTSATQTPVNPIVGQSMKSGNWSDPTVWFNNTIPTNTIPALISTTHVVTVDSQAAVADGITIQQGATLRFSTTSNAKLTTGKNIINNGRLEMKSQDNAVENFIQFVGIIEDNVVGATMDPVATDVGLWTMGTGALDLMGAYKTPWLNAAGSVSAGATTITTATPFVNWVVGDTIMIVPTRKPPLDNNQGYDPVTKKMTDSFAPEFERRTITAVSGNTITLNTALTYNHLQVDSVVNGVTKSWTAEVANLTRNVRIEGEDMKRAHIFTRSSVPQSVKNIRIRYMGPRKIQTTISDRATSFIKGRYGLHFHHCLHGSAGTIVDSVVNFDCGAKFFVPHVSHGITMTNNVAFNGMEQGFWWDFQEQTHDLLVQNNLIACIIHPGIYFGSTGMELNMGDGNRALNNMMVYGMTGALDSNGGYQWTADTEGVWIFEGNRGHSMNTGIWVWQNTTNNHTVVDFETYNCAQSINHGAYANSYQYIGGYHYNSPLFNEATPGNWFGASYTRITWDCPALNYCAQVIDSPIGGDPNNPNKFVQCTFRSLTAGVQLTTRKYDGHPDKTNKYVDIISCDGGGKPLGVITGQTYESTDVYWPLEGTAIRIQPVSGQSTKTTVNAGTSPRTTSTINISDFAPKQWGTGKGFKGDYYWGTNFDEYLFTRVDSSIQFQAWAYDMKYAQTEVNWRLFEHTNNQLFSIRWTGFIEAQYTGNYQFRVRGASTHKLWVGDLATPLVQSLKNGVLSEGFDNTIGEGFVSAPIAMVAGQKYAIKYEITNSGGYKGALLEWKSTQMVDFTFIPPTQAYSS